ncbi:hypothetical protein AB0E64_23175 [Streptomyces caelestis]|uniref:Uncharacterized protein n=1 Tax=Streptomyces caelestis TaxID=36816 RepID=A0A7W9LQE4_9ACTN|nr:hypothetical protein [Streptomyces caelestis]MBB5792373.1 hypothetical protein [Streptomyces caelestis]
MTAEQTSPQPAFGSYETYGSSDRPGIEPGTLGSHPVAGEAVSPPPRSGPDEPGRHAARGPSRSRTRRT